MKASYVVGLWFMGIAFGIGISKSAAWVLEYPWAMFAVLIVGAILLISGARGK